MTYMQKRDHSDRLFELAKIQHGYFTHKEALELGYKKNNYPYYIKKNIWERCYRGVYRLTNYPVDEYDQLTLLYIWSRNNQGVGQGVFSHETALSLYDISDANPSKIHMSVPKNFRRNSAIPKVLSLHYSNIKPEETRDFDAFKITSPLRTIVDIINCGYVERAIIRQAINESVKKGLLLRKDLENNDFIKTYFYETI